MKILLVVPRYSNSATPDYNYLFPLGLGYISSVMKQEHEVECLNLNHAAGNVSDILSDKLSHGYDVVATGHIGIGYSMVRDIFNTIRLSGEHHNHHPKIILGGAMITSEPELIFKSLNPDYGVIGEGEKTIIDLLGAVEGKKTIEGVDGIIHASGMTNQRALIKNIDEIPFPDMEGLGFKEFVENQFTNRWYYNNYFDEPRVYPILASRSCPFQCTFCYHSIGSVYRERSLDNVFEEIDLAVKKYKINTLVIYDDLFSLKRERIVEFSNRIKPYDLKWTCQMSVRTMDKELLNTMKASGCEIISYGFESYSQEVLKSMKKPITPQQINEAFKMTLDARMGVQANFIFGDTAETWNTAMETLNYWKDNSMGQVNLGFIQPYPKSEMYTRSIEKGVIKDKLTFIEENMATDETYNMTESMTDEEIEKLDKLIQKYMSKYEKYVVPNSVKKEGRGYSLNVKCPFCNKEILYKNCFLMVNRSFYWAFLTCRNCNMRFNVVSPLAKAMNDLGLLQLMFRLYKKMRRKRKIISVNNAIRRE